MGKRRVELSYSFEFENKEDARRGAARLVAAGVSAEVKQGRFDGELSDTIWWVRFDDVRWRAGADALFDDFVAEAEARAAEVERRLADVGCVQSL